MSENVLWNMRSSNKDSALAACPQNEAPPSLRDVACPCMDLLLRCAEGASQGDLPQVGGCAATAFAK